MRCKPARWQKADLTSVVTASGEIRPKNYTNVLGEGIGKITDIVVKEGDHVKKGDVLLQLENIQPGADVQAQQAAIDSAEARMSARPRIMIRPSPPWRNGRRIWRRRSSTGSARSNFTKNN